jgi:hypothetical protein
MPAAVVESIAPRRTTGRPPSVIVAQMTAFIPAMQVRSATGALARSALPDAPIVSSVPARAAIGGARGSKTS